MDTDAVLERRRLRRRASFWRIAAFVFLAAAIIIAIGLSAGFDGFERGAVRGQVAEIRIDGFIDTRPDAAEVIGKAGKEASVKAILLRIDSPGGAASGGEALYRSIRAAAETKPVVALIEGMGASGAYMAAIAADHIVARESAITGSIGVIFQYGHFEELLAKIGAQYEEVKSAPLKGEPSLFREPNPAAEEMLQAVVDDTYDWFVGLVADRRGMSAAEARRVADGSIYTGRQALRLDLIDAIGGEGEARAWLAAEKGISADLPLRQWKKDRPLLPSFGANALAGIARLVGVDPAAGLLPQRLAVDGLLSVWQGSEISRSDR